MAKDICPRCDSLEIIYLKSCYHCETCHNIWNDKMTRNMKYQWCRSDTESDKEFLGWVYARLQDKGDSLTEQHMKRLDEITNTIWGTIPDGPPMTIDITDSKPVIIKRHGKVIYNEVGKCP